MTASSAKSGYHHGDLRTALVTAALERREDHLVNGPIDQGRHQNAVALGYGYKLSKRTELYATVAHMSNDDNATRKLGTSLAHTVAAGKNATGYELGLRHNF